MLSLSSVCASELTGHCNLQESPLIPFLRFAIRSSRFIDAYHKGLNGSQAAWAAKKYRGHRVLPSSILDELDAAKVI
jgi:hypothetical protein